MERERVSDKALAYRLDVDIRTIRGWMTGRQPGSLQAVLTLADVLRCDVRDLCEVPA